MACKRSLVPRTSRWLSYVIVYAVEVRSPPFDGFLYEIARILALEIAVGHKVFKGDLRTYYLHTGT